MRIGIDIRSLAEGSRTGVEEYVINLLEHIFAKDRDNEYVLFFNSFRKSRTDFTWIDKYSNVKIKKFRIPNKILNFCLWYFKYPKVDKLIGGVDVMFSPNIIFTALSKEVKFVITIHDLSYMRYPEFFSAKRRLWHWIINPRRLCRRADKIIAVSDSTASDIVSLFSIPGKKIERIYSGMTEKFEVIDRNDYRLIEIKEFYRLPFKFILYFGTIEPRKNIISLVRAYDLLRDSGGSEFEGNKLVLAGKKGWKCGAILREIDASPYKKDILLTGFIPEEDKPYLYNLASVSIYPSFFEGFGFPPLEAMASGVPVVCSNKSSLPEIVGGSAIMIDPFKPQELADALKMVLSDKEFRNYLIEEGKKRAQKFSWEKSAEDTIKVFKSFSHE